MAAALSAEHGIGVRAGKFCAHILVDTLLDEGSDEHDTAVRVSAGLANTPEHVERLLAAVATLAADGPGRRLRAHRRAGLGPGRRHPRAVGAAALVTAPAPDRRRRERVERATASGMSVPDAGSPAGRVRG